MKGYVFPGQASQFEGMGKDMYDASEEAKALFEKANDLLGFRITDVMFEGTAEDLKQTKVTQPAVFLHSIVKASMHQDSFDPGAVAGHSLGEFSALVAAKALSFEDALKLVYQRAMAMQKACEATESTMAAILGLDDEVVEDACAAISDVVVPANYNCPGQLVISGTIGGIDAAVEKLKDLGARRALVLPVWGSIPFPFNGTSQGGALQSNHGYKFSGTDLPDLSECKRSTRKRSGKNQAKSDRSTHRASQVDPNNAEYDCRWRYGIY